MPLVRDLLSSVIALVLVGACTRAPPLETPVQSDAAVTAAIQPAPAPADATLQVPGPVAGARLTERGVLALEHAALDALSPATLVLDRRRRHGDTTVSLYRSASPSGSD